MANAKIEVYMLTREEANKILSGENVKPKEDSQPSETKPSSTPAVVEPDSTTGNPNPDSATPSSTETATQASDDQPPKEDKDKPKDKSKDKSKEESDLGDPSKLPYPKATKPTDDAKGAAQYKANKAFIKQKEKYKSKIRGYEAQLAEMQKKLDAYEKANLEGLDPEKVNDLKFDKRLLEHDIRNVAQSRQAAIDEYESAQADEIHQSRIEKCFTDQAEIDHYNKLLENGRDKFVEFLAQTDPENAVLQYLDDTDNSPLLVRLLMTRPDVLRSVVSKRSPMMKAMELKSIETKLMMNRRLRQTSPNTPPAQTQTPPKSVATTGKVVGSPAAKATRPVTHNDWREHLRQHP